MNDNDAGVLELFDDWAGIVAGRLDNLDALLDRDPGIGRVVWRGDGRQEGDVDSESISVSLCKMLNRERLAACQSWCDIVESLRAEPLDQAASAP